MMEADSTFETSVNFYHITGATTQEAVVNKGEYLYLRKRK
jgi:hypothetical protein